MKYNSLQLCNAPMSAGYMHSTRTGTYPPLNIATIGAFIKEHDPSREVELLDADMIGMTNLCKRISSEIVGISCNIMTYDAALKIAESASANGSKVVLGGPFPTSMPETILKNRPYVDAIVSGDGEIAMFKYLKGEPEIGRAH